MVYLSLAEVAQNPADFATPLWTATGEQIFLRPLISSDGGKLARFLAGLSAESRRLSTFSSYDRATADERCDAIARDAVGWGAGGQWAGDSLLRKEWVSSRGALCQWGWAGML